MQIVSAGGKVGVFSWADGFVFSDHPENHRQEASKSQIHACNVIARLMHQGRWDEAEEVMDRFMK